MMYDVLFSESALKQLKRLDQTTQERVIAVLERIRVRPERHLKKLVNEPGYRLRAGDYRIIIDLDNKRNQVFILKIGHRRDIYLWRNSVRSIVFPSFPMMLLVLASCPTRESVRGRSRTAS